jgi:hypothetical protein
MKRNEIIGEVSLGNYRDKALKQKAQSQMGAMFAKDPEERKKNLATFNKREKGLNRLKARDEKSRKADADKKQAADIAALPQLKAEYEGMKDKYKSLGGSNWQYADREQNLTDREREARSMEGPMNNLWRRINAAEKAQKSESANISERVTPEWIEVNRKAKELLAKGMTVDQVAKQLGVQGPNNGMTGSMGGLWGAINAAKQQMGAGKMESVEEALEEGRGDYVGDAIEGLKMYKPGLEKEDFLDELYSYIDAEMGMDAAEAAFADKDSYDDWYDSYADTVEENTGMLKVAKDDEQQTILQNPTTGVQTQIDKKNPNAPRLAQDDKGKLTLSMPKTGGMGPEKAPNLVGKEVQVSQMPEMLDIRRLAGLK